MYYYCEKNENEEITVLGQVEEPEQIPSGCNPITEEQWEQYRAEREQARLAELKAAEEIPTPEERLRADIDYLAALQGVTL